MLLSLMYVVNKVNLKCRIYEDDYETSVYDFNNNIRRRIIITNNNNFYYYVK